MVTSVSYRSAIHLGSAFGSILRTQLVIAICGAALIGCGGGGGGGTTPPVGNQPQPNVPVDPANQADGLGDRGETSGTSALGVVDGFPHFNGPIAIALSDSGAALAVWSMKDNTSSSGGETLSWSSSAANAGWTAPARLSQAGSDRFYFSGLTIKSNSSGNFALGWGSENPDSSMSQVALRFLSGRWEDKFYNLARGQTDTFESASAWDLDMLTDNGMVTAASFHDHTTDKYTHAIVHVDATGTTTTPAQTDPASGASGFSQYSYFATLKNGSGLFIYTEQQFPSNTYKVFARLASVSTGQRAPLEITTFTGSLCVPMVAATSLSGRTTLALIPGPNCNELHLINVDVLASTIVTDQQVIPTGSTAQRATTPQIVVDAAGNALAVWPEVAADQNASFKWSAAPLNGNWSTPADLVPNFSSPIFNGPVRISLAMNPAGQAAAALRLPLKAANGEIKQFISVSRYTAAGGWQEWKAVANKANLYDPVVSINTQGNAIVGYRGRDSTRHNGSPLVITGTTVPDKVFALKF